MEKNQKIKCDVNDCKHCNCECDECKLETIKVCNCEGHGEKENTMCDSYDKKKTINCLFYCGTNKCLL